MQLPKKTKYFIPIAVSIGICFLAPENGNAFFFENIDIVPHAALIQAFDDNVTFAKGNKKSDNVTNLMVGLEAKQEGRTYQLNIQGNMTQHLFTDNSSFNNNSQDINVDLRKEISKYDRISVTNRFVHGEDPQSFEDDFGRTSGRYSYYRNTFNTTYTRDVSKHVSVEGRYGNENYSASEASTRSSLLHRVGFDIHYIQSSAMAYLLGYDFTTRYVKGSGSADVHTLSSGFRYFLTKQLYVDTRAGVSFVEAFDGSGAVEPNFVASITNDFNETDSASLSYSQTSIPSSFTADIFDSWRVTLSIARQLLERLRMTMSVFLGKGDFEALSINDKQTGVNAQLSYDVSKDSVAFLAYTYSQVDSNIDTRSYDRNLFELGVRIHF